MSPKGNSAQTRLLVVAVALLAISTVLQSIVVWQLSGLEIQAGNEPTPSLTRSQRPIPVEITNRRDIDVRVNNHYITSGDPIPVEIVR